MSNIESNAVATIVHARTYEELKKDMIPESKFELATIYSFMLSLSEDWAAAVAVRLNHIGQQVAGGVAVSMALLSTDLTDGLVAPANFSNGYCTSPSGIIVGGDRVQEAYLAKYTDLSGYSPFVAATALSDRTSLLASV